MQSITASQISFDTSKSCGGHNSNNGSVSNGGSSSFRDLPTPRAPDSTSTNQISAIEHNNVWPEVLPRVSPAEPTRRGSLRSPPTQDVGPSFHTQVDATGGSVDFILQSSAPEARTSLLDNLQSSAPQLELSNALSPEQQLRLLQQPSCTSPALEELKSRHQQLSRLVFPESSRQAVITALRNLQEKIRLLEEEKSLAEAQLAAAASSGQGNEGRLRSISQHSQPIQTEPIAKHSTSVQVASQSQHSPSATTAGITLPEIGPYLAFRGAVGGKTAVRSSDEFQARDLHTPEQFPSPPSPLPRLTAQSVHELEKQLMAATGRCRVLEDQLKLMQHLLRGGDRPFVSGPPLESTARPRMPAYRASLDTIQASDYVRDQQLEEHTLHDETKLRGGDSTLAFAEELAVANATSKSKQSSLFSLSVSGSRHSILSGFGSSDALAGNFKSQGHIDAPTSAEAQAKLFEHMLPSSEPRTPSEHVFNGQDVLDGPRLNPAQIGQPLPSFVLSPIDARQTPVHHKSSAANKSPVDLSLRPPIGFDSPSPRKLVQSVQRTTAGVTATRDPTPLQSTFRAREPVVAPALDLCSSLSHLSPLAESVHSQNLLAGLNARSPCLLSTAIPVRDTHLSTVASNDFTQQSSVHRSVEEPQHVASSQLMDSLGATAGSKYVSYTAAELTASTRSHADALGLEVGFDSLTLDRQQEERSNSVAGAAAGVIYDRVSRAGPSPSTEMTSFHFDERQGSASRQSDRSFLQQQCQSVPRAVLRDSSSNSSSSERLYSQVIPLGRHQQSTPPSAKSASKRVTPQSTKSTEHSRGKPADFTASKHESQSFQPVDTSRPQVVGASAAPESKSCVEHSTQVDATQIEHAEGVLQSSWRREQLRTVLAELECERGLFCAREVRLYEKLAAPHEPPVRREIQRDLALMHAKIEQRREQIEFLRALLLDESVLETANETAPNGSHAAAGTQDQQNISLNGEHQTASLASLNAHQSFGSAGQQNEAATKRSNRPTSRSRTPSTGAVASARSSEPSEVQIVTTVRARGAGATLARPVIVYNYPHASLASHLSSRRSDPVSSHHFRQSSELSAARTHVHNGRFSNV